MLGNSSSEEMEDPKADLDQDFHPTKKAPRKIRKQAKKIPKIISSTYLKKKCEFFNRGNCMKGTHCTFSHEFTPDVAKKICKFFLSNSCSKGSSCPFSHNTKRYPCKFFHIQDSCMQMQDCRFSHDPVDEEFMEEFLKDNEDFLAKIAKTDQKIYQKFSQYIDKNDLLNEEKKKDEDELKNQNIGFIFGLPLDQVPANQKTIQDPRIRKKDGKTEEVNQSSDPRIRTVKQVPTKNIPKTTVEDPRMKVRSGIINKADEKIKQVQVKEENLGFQISPIDKFYFEIEQYMRSFF